jgi:hypothetical protein
MSPKRLIQEWHFGPATMKVAERAFDEAWEQIKRRFDGDAKAAKLDLAKAVVKAIADEAANVAEVKAEALRAIRMAYPPTSAQRRFWTSRERRVRIPARKVGLVEAIFARVFHAHMMPVSK